MMRTKPRQQGSIEDRCEGEGVMMLADNSTSGLVSVQNTVAKQKGKTIEALCFHAHLS